MKINGKFWIVSELFYPNETSSGYYLTEIAVYLAQWQQVNVICGPFWDDNRGSIQDISKNIILHRLNVKPFNKNQLLKRILGLLHLTLSFTYQILIRVKKNDSVWLVTNPAFLVPIITLISKIKGFRIAILVHDVFPENLVPAGLSNNKQWTYQFIKYIFDKAYSQVDKIVVCGRDMGLVFEKKIGVTKINKINIIENWADIDTVYPSTVNKEEVYGIESLNDKLVIQFAGNIGRLQGLELLIEIIKNIKNDLLHFVFIGDGAMKEELIKQTDNLKNVSFLPPFKRDKQLLFLNACDIAIVSLYESMTGLGVPSKSYNIMAAGKPILYFGSNDSEIGMVVKENQIGWQFSFSDRDKIRLFFNNLNDNTEIDRMQMGKKARKIAEIEYSKHIILEKYQHLFTSPPYSPPSKPS